jgi:hypothetical protein
MREAKEKNTAANCEKKGRRISSHCNGAAYCLHCMPCLSLQAAPQTMPKKQTLEHHLELFPLKQTTTNRPNMCTIIAEQLPSPCQTLTTQVSHSRQEYVTFLAYTPQNKTSLDEPQRLLNNK